MALRFRKEPRGSRYRPNVAFALVRAIEIIGEAASRVSVEQRAGSPALPWSAIVAMRNRLIHAYFDIDRDIADRNAKRDVYAHNCWHHGSHSLF